MFFVDAEGGLVAAEVEADSTFRVLRSETLFDTSNYFVGNGVTERHDIGPDDERFLMLRVGTAGDSSGDTRFVLVENWFTELRERLGSN